MNVWLRLAMLVAVCTVGGCSDDAMSVCRRLADHGVASHCQPSAVPSEAPLTDAIDSASFAMRTSGGEGQVLLFRSEASFTAVSEILSRTSRVSKHGVSRRQGYVGALAMVFLSEGATDADERGTRAALGQRP